MVNDRVCLLRREGEATMIIVRVVGRAEEWQISASYARLLATELLAAADQADAEDDAP